MTSTENEYVHREDWHEPDEQQSDEEEKEGDDEQGIKDNQEVSIKMPTMNLPPKFVDTTRKKMEKGFFGKSAGPGSSKYGERKNTT